MTTAIKIERQHITLSDESVIVFDYVDGTYRMVLYRRRRLAERLHQVDAATFDYLTAQRILPKSYRTGWARFATFNTVLGEAINSVIKASDTHYDATEVEDYIRAMPCVRDLP